MEFTTRDTELDRFVDAVEMGDAGLPEFQRDFIWKPSQIVDLLRSIAKRWPTGAFLILEGMRVFAARPISLAPALRRDPRYLVLDGQQRLTSAYHAFYDRSDEVYYLKLSPELISSDPDDCFQSKARDRFEYLYPNHAVQAAHSIIKICDFRDDRAFFDWLRYADSDVASIAQGHRDGDWAGLRRNVYRTPTTYLTDDTPIEAIAKIFETVNRTGVRLDTFDLMTAATYNHARGFNLRAEWEHAREVHPILDYFEVDGVEILRLIALMVRESSERKSLGVRQSDVLRLRAEAVHAEWHKAIDAYVSALGFAHGTLGAITPKILPSTAMVLTLAFGLSRNLNAASLASWWWRAGYSQAYSQGANTQVTADVETLLRGAIPGVAPLEPTVFLEGRRRNELLLSTSLCSVMVLGPPNPVDGRPYDFGEDANPFFVAPIWPLEPGEERQAAVANFVLVQAPRRMASKLMRIGLRGLLGHQLINPDISAHGIDINLMVRSSYDTFVGSRARWLADLAATRLWGGA